MSVMLAFLSALSFLLAQGVPVLPRQGGTVTGIVRLADGAPAAGVRVAALARPDALKDLATASSFAGLTETEATGRYRLENIPAGRYYIIAGRVDAPTFYPGTVQASEGTVVSVPVGATVPAIDFVLNNASLGRAPVNSLGSGSWVTGIQTRMEDGSKVPIFAAGRFPVLSFARPGSASTSTTINLALNEPNVTLWYPDYRVTVENLPSGYALKSLLFGPTNLVTGPLVFSLPLRTQGTAVVALAASQPITVVLARTAVPQRPGVRVTGRIPGDPKRSIYISGFPGAIYADGTFEFVGVSPGVHRIVTLDNPYPSASLGAMVVVGDRDVLNVELDALSLPPADSNHPAPPPSAGNRIPGSRAGLLTIGGRVVDGDTGEPFTAGRVVINNEYRATVSLNDKGRFEVANLLPGNYTVEVTVFGVGILNRAVVLDEKDIFLDMTAR